MLGKTILAGGAAVAVLLGSTAAFAKSVERKSASVTQAESIHGVEWYMAALLTMLAGFAGGVFDGGDGAPVSP